MRTIEELRQFFNLQLYTPLLGLERQRKDVLRKVLAVYSVAAAVVFAGVIFFLNGTLGQGSLFIFLLGIAGAGIGHVALTRGYRSRFKDIVIQPLILFFDEQLRYDKGGMFPHPLYAQSNIFLHHVDRYQGDDLVEGVLGQTKIQFSELHTEYMTTTTDSKGRTHTQWHTIFKGLFFMADFNKHFHARTVVLPDMAEKALGGLGKFFQSKNMSRGTLMTMDDPVFEKEFVVYGTDQIEARYILTASLMKRIVDFKNKTGRPIYLSFVDSNIFIAIPYTKNLFEPNIFKTLLDFSVVEEYFSDLKAALDIVDELNLNTRIWTKE